MFIQSNNKSMEFKIIGYEFPDHKPSIKGYDYDANWLICEVKYSEEDLNEVYRDPCLLSYELKKLISSLSRILKDEIDSYISDFMEPYLQISIVREKELMFTIQFECDNANGEWNNRTISAAITKTEAIQMLNELVEFQKTYPER